MRVRAAKERQVGPEDRSGKAREEEHIFVAEKSDYYTIEDGTLEHDAPRKDPASAPVNGLGSPSRSGAVSPVMEPAYDKARLGRTAEPLSRGVPE